MTRNRTVFVSHLAILQFCWCGSVSADSFLDEWHVFGSNTLRASNYDAHGLKAASPYPFEGGMYYDEFNLHFMRRDTPYDFWRGEISGVLNPNDDYRSVKTGFVPERINLTRENGSSSLPYRVELGDHFAHLSYLTLQRSLKGVRWELQPVSAVEGRNHSFVFISGLNEPNWRDVSRRDDYTNAVSWLMQDQGLGTYGVNIAQNYRRGSNLLGTLGRNQVVMSLVGEKSFRLGGMNTVLEGELARFAGDHNGITGPASGQGTRDSGAFVQWSGLGLRSPWDYQLRYQRYGQHFQPRSGIITPDQRSLEGFTSWRFDAGVLMRFRAQKFRNFVESANPLDTRTLGVNFAGPLLWRWWPDAMGSLDYFSQRRWDRTSAVDQNMRNFDLNLSKPLSNGWIGRLGLLVQNIDDMTAAAADRYTRELRLSAGHNFRLGGFDGYVTPGMMLRSVRRGGNASNDIEPTLSVQLFQGPHAMRADIGSLTLNRLTPAGIDTKTYRANFGYTYSRHEHILGVEANLFGRGQSPGASTDAHRISVFWTFNFDKPPAAGTAALPVARVAAGTGLRLDLVALSPGLRRTEVEKLLADEGIGRGTQAGGFIVFEHPLQRDILQRQRLALEFVADTLDRSALVIEFGTVGSSDTNQQIFERIRQLLIRQLGNPGRTYDKGEFGPDFPNSVNAQQLIRLTEWMLPDGSTVRFGIPRRLDGEVRMEIQHARKFPPPTDTRWSVESVR
ncbi:MAG: hypothetical protein IT368_10660 [Candidatus Hydrogenedentes bacterium]|jgi:hypothetical protein|nr:hypothetical protein [Candidatus Hydrogenedentota bacterium]